MPTDIRAVHHTKKKVCQFSKEKLAVLRPLLTYEIKMNEIRESGVGEYKDTTAGCSRPELNSFRNEASCKTARLWITGPDLRELGSSTSTSTRSSTRSSTRHAAELTLKRLPNRPKPGTYPQPLCTGRCSLSADVVMLICPAHSQEITMLEHTVCPVCHQPAIDITLRTRRSIATVDAICANHHIWEIRWLLPVVPIRDQEAS